MNDVSETQQRWGNKGIGRMVDLKAVQEEVKKQDEEKAQVKSGFQRGYGGQHGHEASGDQTTAAAPGKRVWQPKGTSFEDKMAAQRAKEGGNANAAPPTATLPHKHTPPMHPPGQTASPPTAGPPTPPLPKPASPPPARVPAVSTPPPQDPLTSPTPSAPTPPAEKPMAPPPRPTAPPPSQPPGPPPKPAQPRPPTLPSTIAREDSETVHTKGLAAVTGADEQLKRHDGGAFGAYHSYGEEKVVAFTEYINFALGADLHLADVLPMAAEDLFNVIADGLVLCQLINKAQPGIIFEKAINFKIKSVHHKVENLNLAINSAKSIGCNVVNIGAQDLLDGRQHLVLGLLWQVIKIMLLQRVSLKHHPELAVLLQGDEELSMLLKMPREELLVRWVNHHLAKSESERRLSNFSTDLKDGEIYTHLMARICPQQCDLAPLRESDEKVRVAMILRNAEAVGCAKFVRARDILSGNKDLNLAFTAVLFNEYPALEIEVDDLRKVDAASIDELLQQEQGTREQRVFCNWVNSLGPEVEMNDLLADSKSGLRLLEVIEKIQGDQKVVDWKMVNKKAKVQIKAIENCNYLVDCAKTLGCNIVNMGGKDIFDQNEKLVLALVWQLMRHDTMSMLEKLGGGGKLSDSDLLQWANSKVPAKAGKILSLGDPSLGTGLFVLHLCDSVKSGVVDWDIVTQGETEADRELNAKYVLSVARKMGCAIFLLWEDVVEVNSKMLSTFFGSLMFLDRSRL